jgi:hypothetical protein
MEQKEWEQFSHLAGLEAQAEPLMEYTSTPRQLEAISQAIQSRTAQQGMVGLEAGQTRMWEELAGQAAFALKHILALRQTGLKMARHSTAQVGLAGMAEPEEAGMEMGATGGTEQEFTWVLQEQFLE